MYQHKTGIRIADVDREKHTVYEMNIKLAPGFEQFIDGVIELW